MECLKLSKSVILWFSGLSVFTIDFFRRFDCITGVIFNGFAVLESWTYWPQDREHYPLTMISAMKSKRNQPKTWINPKNNKMRFLLVFYHSSILTFSFLRNFSRTCPMDPIQSTGITMLLCHSLRETYAQSCTVQWIDARTVYWFRIFANAKKTWKRIIPIYVHAYGTYTDAHACIRVCITQQCVCRTSKLQF